MAFVLILPWTLVLALLLGQPESLPVVTILLFACASSLVLSVFKPLSPWLKSWRPLLSIVLAAVIGWQLAVLAQARFEPWLLDQQNVYEIIGSVEGLPDKERFGSRMRLRVDCVSSSVQVCDVYRRASVFWPVLVDVTIPHKMLPQAMLPGQRWQIRAHWVATKNADPFSSFDTARWLRSNHIVAQFRLKRGDSAVVLDVDTVPVQMARLTLRETVSSFQEQHVPSSELSGLPVVLALVTGDRSLMTPAHWHIFNSTGTTHLIAISGAHIMLVTGVVVWLFNALLRRSVRITQRVPSISVALVLGWLVALAYGAIAGLGFPVQRALIMLSLVVLFKLWGRAQPLWLAWNLAFLLVVVWDPMAVFSIGFWLSFLAVYWILWVSGGRVIKVSKAEMWWRVQWGIFFGLAPVLLWQLQNLSLVSTGTNLYAIPLIGLILTPLSLLWALGWWLLGDAANVLLFAANKLAQWVIWLLQWCADTPFSLLTTTPHPASAMVLALIGVAWLCTAGLPGRWLAPVLCLPLLLPAHEPLGAQVIAGKTSPQLVIEQGNHLLFVSRSEWPKLDGRWQQNILRFKGIAVPESNVAVQHVAALWQAPAWTLSDYTVASSMLGTQRITNQTFADLCLQKMADFPELDWEVLYRNPKGDQCAVVLQWAGEHLLLLTSLPQKAQRLVLERLQVQAPVRWVLIHPHKQDRLSRPLLQFWQRSGTHLVLTRQPSSKTDPRALTPGLSLSILSEADTLSLQAGNL